MTTQTTLARDRSFPRCQSVAPEGQDELQGSASIHAGVYVWGGGAPRVPGSLCPAPSSGMSFPPSASVLQEVPQNCFISQAVHTPFLPPPPPAGGGGHSRALGGGALC